MMRIPSELLEYKQWVLWRGAEANGRITKIPISPWSGKAAACDKPKTWSTYRHARYALRRHRCDGVGFVFTEADPFCGIDLDHCRASNGSICPDALALIKRLNSYTELSPSGTGAHILIKATLPGTGRRTDRIEMYNSGRYFTITGRHLSGTPLYIHDRQELVTDLQRELFVPLMSSSGRRSRMRFRCRTKNLLSAQGKRATETAFDVCGRGTLPIMGTITAARTWPCAGRLSFGVAATRNELIACSVVPA